MSLGVTRESLAFGASTSPVTSLIQVPTGTAYAGKRLVVLFMVAVRGDRFRGLAPRSLGAEQPCR